jgi:hypothetical protein
MLTIGLASGFEAMNAAMTILDRAGWPMAGGVVQEKQPPARDLDCASAPIRRI